MNARATALLWAVLFLRDRQLRANAQQLIGSVDKWLELARTDKPMRYGLAVSCGITAAEDCAMPCWSPGVDLIEPEDLRD